MLAPCLELGHHTISFEGLLRLVPNTAVADVVRRFRGPGRPLHRNINCSSLLTCFGQASPTSLELGGGA